MNKSINQILNHFWSLRREFAKYFIIGISAFILDVGSLDILKQRLGFPAVWSVVINQPPILLWVFFFNKHWSFGAVGLTHRQLIRFLTVAGMNYAISVVWIWWFSQVLGFNALWARTVNIAVAVGWNFLLYKFWVYHVHKSAVSS